jgi:hypothetical protein
LGYLVAAGRRTFDGDVVEHAVKIGELVLSEFEDVASEPAGAGGGLD